MSDYLTKPFDALSVFNTLSGCHLVLLPDAPRFTIAGATDAFLAAACLNRAAIVGSGVLDAFGNTSYIGASNALDLTAALARVLEQKKELQMANQRFACFNSSSGVREARDWSVTNKPVLDHSNNVQYIIHTITEITEVVPPQKEKRAELNVWEKAESLRNVFHHAPTAMFIFRGENMIIDNVNIKALEMIRRTADVVGKPLLEAIPELKDSPAYQIFQDVYQSGAAQYGQEVLVPLERNGVLEDRYFNFAYTPLKEGGQVVGVVDVATEVTEQVVARKKIEAVQRETEKQKRLYETITGNTPDLIYVFDLEYRFTYANEALLNMWGKTAAQAVGKRLLENGYEPWHAEMHEREIDQVVATKKAIRGAVSFPHATLGKRIYDYIFVPVINEKGDVEAIAGTTRDITDLKQAERKVRESEHLLRSMIMQSQSGICVLSGTPLRAEMVNDAFLAISGKTREAFETLPYWEVLKEAEPFYAHILKNVFRTGERFSVTNERVSLMRNGHAESGYFDFLYEPLKNADGIVDKVTLLVVEVTGQVMARRQVEELVAQRTQELATANENLHRINQELQRSNANLEEFAHAASHDLKEPVRKITFFTHQLKDQLANRIQEQERFSFGRIEHATERMTNLIDDLLLYSHVSQRPHATEPTDLNRKVQLVLEDLELDIQERNAVIHVDKLPVVQGYKRQLQQLFQNLLSNALKYSKADVPPHINISAATTDVHGRQFHVISVQDHGIGFDPQYAEKIFQIFSRLHGQREYSGTGVGLSIVKKVVENHNGFIEVDSAVGAGSVFKIYLPCS